VRQSRVDEALRALGMNTAADVSSIALAKEEGRGDNARRADHARCSRPTPLGRNRGEAATHSPFAIRDAPVANGSWCYHVTNNN